MKSITHRLTLWYALIVTFSIAAVLVFGRYYLESSLVKGVDLLNEVEFQEIKSRMDAANAGGNREALLQAIRAHAELDAALYVFQVGTSHENVIYRSANLGPHQLPKEVHGQARVTVTDEDLGPLRSSEFNYGGLDIHIASSLESAEALFGNYTRASIYACLLAFLVSLGVGHGLSRLAMRPVAAIQASARRITASNFKERIPIPNTQDEIARMAALLNEMLDRLEDSYQQVKRFTAEASHEFRTPLSIIRLQAERLLSNPDLPFADQEQALTEQMEEIERLNKMIDDLLLISKADAGVMTLDRKRVDLQDFLEEFRCDAELLAEEKGIRFSLEAGNVSEWTFDSSWIRQVLLNLLANAISASKAGTTITLSVEKAGAELAMRMLDEGGGIPEDQLVRIFNRFERLDKPGESKGNGLGLAICESIVHRHGGRIFARNRNDVAGLVVELRLPEGQSSTS